MRGRHGRPRPVAAAVAAAGLAVALAVAGAAGASSGGVDDRPSGAIAELRREVDAMRAAGLPADHPKVRLLEREIAALEDDTAATSVPDPGRGAPGAGGQATTPGQAARLEEQGDAGTDDAESGMVECEPVPLALSAREADNAVACASVPQPDGTARYLAVEPDGTVHVVAFGHGGHVRRLPDRELPPGAAARSVRLVPEDDGEVTVEFSGGAAVGRLDLG
jgi:hypothetical protein